MFVVWIAWKKVIAWGQASKLHLKKKKKQKKEKKKKKKREIKGKSLYHGQVPF